MKFITRIILLFFVFFLFSSSIVNLIKTEKGIKISLVLEDDEKTNEDSKEVKDLKELKSEFLYETVISHLTFFKRVFKIDNYGYFFNEYTSDFNLFLPPPELV